MKKITLVAILVLMFFSGEILAQKTNASSRVPEKEIKKINSSKISSFAVSSAVSGSIAVAENSTYNSYSVEQLVNNLLISGCLTTSNVRFGYYKKDGSTWAWRDHSWSSTAGNRQLGYFNSASSTFGIDEGIIFSTGKINSAEGPNNTGSKTDEMNSEASDPDLAKITNNRMYDAAVLEFDFVPNGNVVEFKFVFASDEYLEYVETQFNDAFGFFLSGPGISGSGTYMFDAINLAELPNGDAVTVNNIHSAGTNVYGNSFPAKNDTYYVHNPSGSSKMEFDGSTTVLTATHSVTPGQSYKIRMAIADASDQKWDAGVFLKARSFATNTLVVNDPSPVCAPSTVDITVPAITAGSSAGLMYTYWEDANATIPYTTPAFATDGTYYIKASDITSGCSDIKPVVVTVNSVDVVEIESEHNNLLCIGGNDGSFKVEASGGVAPYSYSLNNIDFSNTTGEFNGLTAGTYTVYAKDMIGCDDLTPLTINIAQPGGEVCKIEKSNCPPSDLASVCSDGDGGTPVFWTPPQFSYTCCTAGGGGDPYSFFMEFDLPESNFGANCWEFNYAQRIGLDNLRLFQSSGSVGSKYTDSYFISPKQYFFNSSGGTDINIELIDVTATVNWRLDVLDPNTNAVLYSYSITGITSNGQQTILIPDTVPNGVYKLKFNFSSNDANGGDKIEVDKAYYNATIVDTDCAGGINFVVTSTHIPGDEFVVGTTPVIYTATLSILNENPITKECIFDVVVNDPSAPTGEAEQEFCAVNNPTVANLTTTTGEAIQWYEDATGGTALDSTIALENEEDYYATQTIGGCESTTRLKVVVTISDPNAPTGDSIQTFCSSDNPTVGNLIAIGDNIKWYAEAGDRSPLSSTDSLDDGENYFATQTIGSCESDERFEVTVTINTFINSNAGDDQPLCDTSTFNMSANSPSPGTGLWTIESGTATITTPNSPNTTVTGVNSGSAVTLRWTIENGACSDYDDVVLTNKALDDASFSYEAAAYCVDAFDPTPTITGVTGGAFSSTAGLSINASTGVIDLSASTPGTYTVTYTTNGACENSSTQSVTINALDDASFTYEAAAYCADAFDPTPTITGVTGGAFSSTAGLSINASTGVIDLSASTAGTYTVTYTTNGACENSSTDSVTITALDDASFSYSGSPYCADGTDPIPTITGVTGGTFSSTAGLSINANTGVIDLSASTAGTYTVTYTTNGACENSSTDSVTITALDDASFSYSGSPYCADGTDPTPTITGVTGGTFSSTAGLSINANTGVIDLSASTAGTYTVTYTTNGACENSSTDSVTITALDDASFSYSGSPYCADGTDPIPTITGVTGGTFSSTAGLSINANTGVIDLSASTAGTYTVTYTTNGACENSSTDSVTITALDDASFSYSGSPYCADGTDPIPTITGVTGGTFSSTAGLSINANTGVIDLSASTAGTYTVTYTTNGACENSSTDSVTITALDDASFSYSGSPYCADGTDPTPTITGVTGGTFSSTAGLSINANTGVIDLSASTAGTYTVTYTTNGACENSSTDSVTITALDDASFSYSGSPYCADGTDPIPTITGVTGGTFSSTAGLSINANTGVIDLSASTAGTYTVTYTTNGACENSSTDSVTITALDDASFSYSGSPYCADGTDPIPTITGVTGGTFSSTAGLSINANTGVIDLSASTAGTYTVTYTTNGACENSSTDSVTITALDDASFSYSGSPYCADGTDPTPTITGVTGGTFSSTAGLSINANTGVIDLSASTAGTYTVTYTTNGACENSSTDSVTITALDDASFSYSGSPYCADGTDPTPTITGVTGGTFSSTAGLSINANTGVIDLSASTAGTYTVTYTTNGACENSSTDSVTITALDDASFSYSGSPYCADGTDPIPTITGVTGGTFSSTAGLSINANTGVIDLSASTAGTYTVTYTTNGACENSSTDSVTITALDDASFSYSGSPYCADGTDPIPTITGVTGGTFSSTAGLSINANTGVIDLSASTAGTYTVTYTTNGACENSSTDSVTITALDDASFSYSGSPYCADGTDPIPTITGVTGGTFSSTAGLSINANTGVIDLSASTAGTYTVTYTTNGACENSSTDSVTITALDDASFSYSGSPYCADGTDPIPTITGVTGGTFSSTAGLSINANTGVIDLSASTAGTYTVTYTTNGACENSSTDSVTITALDDASFSYSGSPYCADGTDPTPTITGVTGGTFSSTAGLSINANTGVIDLSASTAGTYTVTYTTNGACENSSTDSVTITALDDASFSYSGSPYCADGTDPIPTITGVTGGTFSSTAGLSINANTGVIDLSASTAGTYTVTYTTNGACENSSTDSVTITALDDASFSYSGSPYCADGTDPIPTITGVTGGTFSSTAGLSINANTGVIDLSASTAGTYTVTYTTNGACENSSTDSVTITALDDASFSYSGSPYCADGTDPTPTITGVTGGTFSSTAGLSINANTGVIDLSASTAGTYTVTYTTNGACENSSTDSVTINALPEVTLTQAGPFCIDADAVQLVASPSGGTFSGTGVSATGLFTPSTAGAGDHLITYTYTDGNSCANSDTKTIKVNALPEVTLTQAGPFCIDAGAVQLVASPSGGIFSGTGVSATGLFTPSTAGAGDHLITYTYTDGNSCANSDTKTIKVNALPEVTLTQAGPFCIDADAVQLVASPTGGTFSGTGVSVTGLFTPATAGAGDHVITYTYTDSNGTTCTSLDAKTIKVNALPEVTLTQAGPFCIDADAVQLVASPTGGTFSGTGVSATGLFIPATAGAGDHVITYTYTDGNSCANLDTKTIKVNGLPEVSAGSGKTITCSNETVVLNGSINGDNQGNLSYEWTTQNGIIDNGINTLTPTVSESGIYTLTVTDTETGCSNSSTVSVGKDISKPAANIAYETTILTCETTSIELDASNSSSDANYIWNTGERTKKITVTEPGNYWLEVSYSRNGCASYAFITITEDVAKPVVEITGDSELTCITASVVLDASSSTVQGTASYLWSTGETTESITVSNPGEYTVTVTDSDNGCDATSEVFTVTEDVTEVVATITGDSELTCATTSVVLDASSSTVQGTASYLWSTGETTESITVSNPGEYTVTVTDSDNGCDATSEVFTVTEDVTEVVATITGDSELTCSTTSVVLDASSSTVQGTASYLWSTGETTESITVSNPGEYTVTVTDSDNGCDATSEVFTVTENITSVVAIITGDSELTCSTTSITLDASSSTVQGTASYSWSDGSNEIGTGATLEVTTAGDYTVTVTDSDNGCDATSEVFTVTENITSVVAIITGDSELTCSTTSITLDASSSTVQGTVSYSWSDGSNEIGTDATLEVTTAGDYTVTVTDSDNGCDATSEVFTVTENITSVVAIITGDSELTCSTTSITLDASSSTVQGTASYSWSDGSNEIGTGATLEVTIAGDYIVTVTDSDNGCDATSEVFTVTEDLTAEVVDITDEITVLCIEDISIDLTTLLVEDFEPGGTWVDEQGSGGLTGDFFDPSIVNLGSYQFTYTEPEDCGRIIKIYVDVNDDCVVLPCSTSELEISKVVTPNNDGFNDQFEILGLEGCGFTFDVQIFNRWGKMIYQSNNYQNNWRGYANTGGTTIGSSTNLPTGTYYYIVNVLSSGFEPITGYIYLGTH